MMPNSEFKDNIIYEKQASSGIKLGEVRNNIIYKRQASSGIKLGEVRNIKREIKGSDHIDSAIVVAAYHFLIKSIF
jgi:ribosome-interacting GTPase 1